MNKREPIFQIDKKFLEIYFGEELKKITKPKSIFQVPVILPFQIPINNVLTFFYDKHNIFCLKFQDIDYEINLPEEFIDETLTNSLQGKFTRVELALITEEDLLNVKDKSYHDYFFKLFTELNNFIFSYQLNSKSIFCNRLSVLEFFSNYAKFRVVDFNNWENKYEGMYVFQEYELIEKNKISYEIAQDILNYSINVVKNWTPFLSAEEASLNALKNFHLGKFKESIIEAQISVELFLCSVYIRILVEEGQTLQDASKYIIDTPFKKIITRDFPQKLGGNWDRTRQESPFGKYWNKSYELRNRIIHSGYYPNYNDSKTAIESSNEFREYLLKLIKLNSNNYPTLYDYLNSIYRGNIKTFGTRAYNSIPKHNFKQNL